MQGLVRLLLPLWCLLITGLAAAGSEGAVTPPKLLHFEQAVYPIAPSAPDVPAPEVEVLLRLNIDEQGSVTAAEVVKSGGEAFDPLALEATKKFTFEPATRDGAPIRVRILFKYEFKPPKPVPKEPIENVVGRVYQRWEKRPLAGVKVEIVGSERSAQTDAQGRFRFVDIPTGNVEISLSRDGFVSATLNQRIEDGAKYDLNVGLEPAPEPLPKDEEIDGVAVVRASRVRAEVVETKVERAQGERVAGTQGDVVKVVQTMAGVARPAAAAGELVVWGASPSDTRLYVDWIPVPKLFHAGGARSVLPSDFVSGISLAPGGFGADWGRAIGGLVRVETVQPEQQLRAEARLTGDFIDAGGGTQAWLHPNTWAMASARRSLLKQTFDVVADEQAHELVPTPDYWDYQAKVVHRTSPKVKVDVLALGSSDSVERGIPSVTPDAAFRERSSSSFHRVGLQLERSPDRDTTNRLSAWVGVERVRLRQSFGTTLARLNQNTFRAGLRVDESHRLASFLDLRYGVDAEFAHTSMLKDGALSLPAREGDVVVFGQAPGNRVNLDEWAVDDVAVGVYVASPLTFADRKWSVEPGLRLEPSVVNGDRVVPVRATEPAVGYSLSRFAVEPRLRVTWSPLQPLALYAATGRYDQPAAAADLSPIFGNPLLEQPHSVHYLAGARVSSAELFQLELTGFLVRQSRLTARSELATPPLAKLVTSDGEGRNYGAQATVRLRFSESAFAWATYSLMRAQRRANHDEPWRLFDLDQTHIAQVVASWAQERGPELGARVQLSSGFPRTPVEGAAYNAGSGDYDPIFGRQNSMRLPTFFSAAARVGWRFLWSWGHLKAWLDIQNATNHGNAEEVVYTADYKRHGFVEGLPLLPVLGVEIKWWNRR